MRALHSKGSTRKSGSSDVASVFLLYHLPHQQSKADALESSLAMKFSTAALLAVLGVSSAFAPTRFGAKSLPTPAVPVLLSTATEESSTNKETFEFTVRLMSLI